jgi:hypothetical protein
MQLRFQAPTAGQRPVRFSALSRPCKVPSLLLKRGVPLQPAAETSVR